MEEEKKADTLLLGKRSDWDNPTITLMHSASKVNVLACRFQLQVDYYAMTYGSKLKGSTRRLPISRISVLPCEDSVKRW